MGETASNKRAPAVHAGASESGCEVVCGFLQCFFEASLASSDSKILS